MNKENTQKLVEAFPSVYSPNKYAKLLRGFGFECDDGWYDLVYEVSQKFHEHNEKHPDKPVAPLIIKEKLGGLRIQGIEPECMTDEIREIIFEAEDRSYTICEQCGKPGVFRRGGYLLATRCDEHAINNWGDPMEPV